MTNNINSNNNNIQKNNNISKYTANEALGDIKSLIDYSSTVDMEQLNEAVQDDNNMHRYIDYVSSDHYRASHYKRSSDFRFEEKFFNIQLENVGDYLMSGYEGQYDDHTLLSDYAIERDEYRHIGISFDDADESIEQGLAIHVDLLNDIQYDHTLELSDRVRRNDRYDNIKANIDKYPDLEQMYEEWEQMGYNYGLHSAYTRDEKEAIRQHWIGKFAEDVDNPHEPAKRMYLINEQYNQLGYDMHLAYEGLRNPTTPLNGFNNVDVMYDQNDTLDLLEDTFDLGDVNHVAAILDIQRESKKMRIIGLEGVFHVNDWFPILSMLSNKYKAYEDAGGIEGMLHELYLSASLSDMDEIQQVIFNLIRQEEDFLYTLDEDWISELLDNPYDMILDYLEIEQGVKLEMRQLKSEINKIANHITNTFNDLLDDGVTKSCVTCKVDKMPNAYTKGKASCKRCRATSRQNKAS